MFGFRMDVINYSVGKIVELFEVYDVVQMFYYLGLLKYLGYELIKV